VADLSMRVGPGEVFGFLGPNGAGKTTAVKMLLGLARPTGGRATVLGAPIGDRLARRRIGYLPELFRYQPWLRAREVLELHGRLIAAPSGPTASDIELGLDEVGLGQRANDAVGTFSKGMQQRLGLAVALLGRPRLIVLDEPTSALDPSGRADVRAIIATVRARGATVFLNSHLLSEVERVCDRIAIVDRGRVLASGTLDDLLGADRLRVRVTDLPPNAVTELARFGPVAAAGDDWLSIAGVPAERHPDVVAFIVRRGGRVHAVDGGRRSLEDRYLELIRANAAVAPEADPGTEPATSP
jgi:ABC-2 type transport system ATP-binding protein